MSRLSLPNLPEPSEPPAPPPTTPALARLVMQPDLAQAA